MIRVNKCCCCVNLETGGTVWGCLGVMFAVMSALSAFSDLSKGLGPVHGFVGFLHLMISSVMICASCLLIDGIEERSYEKIQPSRVLAIFEYILAGINIIIIKTTDVTKAAMIEAFKKQHLHAPDPREIEQLGLEAAVFANLTCIAIFVLVVIDFVIRFLVIDSLYYKYKEEFKAKQQQQPSQVV